MVGVSPTIHPSPSKRHLLLLLPPNKAIQSFATFAQSLSFFAINFFTRLKGYIGEGEGSPKITHSENKTPNKYSKKHVVNHLNLYETRNEMVYFLRVKAVIINRQRNSIMSMICTVGQITDTDLRKIIEDPKPVELLLNNGEYFEQTKKSFFQKLFSKDHVKADAWKPKLDEPQCDLDKAWHAIHFLLTGNAVGGNFPLNFIMTGGQEVGDDMGYGPIRILMGDDVKELKHNLDKIDVATFKQKYNPAELNKSEVYPLTSDWTQEEESWIVEEYENLKKFVDQAYQDSKGLYITIQ